MKHLTFILFFSVASLCIGLPSDLNAQKSLSPDDMISHIRDNSECVAFTIPGWLIRWAGRIIEKDVDADEQEIIRELTGHIKRLRFVASETKPDGYTELFKGLRSYMEKHDFEQLMEARDGGTRVHIWGKFDADIIRNLVISVVDNDARTVMLNIKSSIDLERLKKMEFYRDLEEKQTAQNRI